MERASGNYAVIIYIIGSCNAKRPLSGNHCISLDDTYVPGFDLADDICLLEDNAENAQHLLDSVVHTTKNVGLKINTSKTKFCSIDPNIDITCLGEQLERVEKFTYLGVSLQLNGDITREIKLLCAKSLLNKAGKILA